MEEVLVNKFTTQAGGVWAEVVLNRPQRKNAITGPLGIRLAESINILNADDQVQAIMLRGEVRIKRCSNATSLLLAPCKGMP